MNQTKTTRLRNPILAVSAILFILAGGANAQQKLGDLVTEGGFDWLIGKWQATTDEGDKFELVYEWGLEKYMATIRFKTPDLEYRGIIFYKPTEDKIVQVGVDNQGGNGTGTWEAQGNKAVLKHEHIGADWQSSKMGFAHLKVDANAMKWEIYEVYSSGELGDYPNYTIEFKRHKEQAPKKESDKSEQKKKNS